MTSASRSNAPAACRVSPVRRRSSPPPCAPAASGTTTSHLPDPCSTPYAMICRSIRTASGVWLGDGMTSSATITTVDRAVIDEIVAAGYEAHRTSAPYGWRIGSGRDDRRRDEAGRYCADGGLNSVLRAEGLLGDRACSVAVPDCELRAAVGSAARPHGQRRLQRRDRSLRVRQHARAPVGCSCRARCKPRPPPGEAKEACHAQRHRVLTGVPGQVHAASAGLPPPSEACQARAQAQAIAVPRRRRRSADPVRPGAMYPGRGAERHVPDRTDVRADAQQLTRAAPAC